MVAIIPSILAQALVFPRAGEGTMNRAEQITFLPDPQFLVPSVFWSKKKMDWQVERKWWRNAPVLPKLENNGLRPLLMQDGSIVWAEPLIEGFISLHREPVYIEDNTAFMDEEFAESSLSYFRYWVSAEKVVQITGNNYKTIIRKLLPEAKELHEKLGKLGFRFENVPSMILYYNRFFADDSLVINNMVPNNMLLRE